MAGVARGEPEGMDFAIDLIQKIPAGWPRFATLAAIIAAYLFFPDIMKKLRGGQKEKVTLERMMQFLQVKKLLLELEVFQKEKNLTGFDFPGEARLLAELKETAIAENKLNDKVPYLSRLKLSLLGGGTFLLLATLLFIFAPREEPASVQGTVEFLLGNLLFSAACGLLASFIPLGGLRASFLYGLTMPISLALLVLLVTQ
jgi:hypothetical protein